MILDMILYRKLHREMGQKSLKDDELFGDEGDESGIDGPMHTASHPAFLDSLEQILS